MAGLPDRSVSAYTRLNAVSLYFGRLSALTASTLIALPTPVRPDGRIRGRLPPSSSRRAVEALRLPSIATTATIGLARFDRTAGGRGDGDRPGWNGQLGLGVRVRCIGKAGRPAPAFDQPTKYAAEEKSRDQEARALRGVKSSTSCFVRSTLLYRLLSVCRSRSCFPSFVHPRRNFPPLLNVHLMLSFRLPLHIPPLAVRVPCFTHPCTRFNVCLTLSFAAFGISSRLPDQSQSTAKATFCRTESCVEKVIQSSIISIVTLTHLSTLSPSPPLPLLTSPPSTLNSPNPLPTLPRTDTPEDKRVPSIFRDELERRREGGVRREGDFGEGEGHAIYWRRCPGRGKGRVSG